MTESSRQTDGGLSSYQRSQLRFPLEDEESSSTYDIASSDRDARRGLDHQHPYQYQQHHQRNPDLSGARRTYYVLLGILMASALYAFLASPPPPFPPAPWAASSSSLSSATASSGEVKVEAAAIPTTVQDAPAASTSASLLMVASKLWGRPRFDDLEEKDEGRHGKLKPKVGAASSSAAASSTSSEAQAVAGLQLQGYPSVADQLAYEHEMGKLDWDAIEADLERVMTDSQDFWPADYGHYGGLFVRLSWHSCGSYRLSDGRGGCDGGGQRYGTINWTLAVPCLSIH
jgi:hypothetical protein